MITPVRIQLSRKAGFNLQTWSKAFNGLHAVKVDRTTRFGNPFAIGREEDLATTRKWGWVGKPMHRRVINIAADAVAQFAHILIWDEAVHEFVRTELGGKNIACWCGLTETCHGDPLLWLANSTPADVQTIHRNFDEALIRMSERLWRA